MIYQFTENDLNKFIDKILQDFWNTVSIKSDFTLNLKKRYQSVHKIEIRKIPKENE